MRNAALTLILFLVLSVSADPAPLLDRLTPGDAASESAHHLTAVNSDIVTGALDQKARRLLPSPDKSWEGGHIAFTMTVDPDRPNYLTARLWGGDPNPNALILLAEGKQVGYRHLGDVDVLALPDDEPRYPGRFYYVTTPLPPAMTRAKREIHLEIRGNGPVWGYARTFDQYQKPMTVPSRGIYALATHTDPCFVPPANEVQGDAPPATKRTSPGPEVLDQAKQRVNAALTGMLKSRQPLNQMQVQFLSRACFIKWSAAHDNPAAATQIVKGIDELHRRYKTNPDELWKDKAVWNPEWFGVGPAADAVRLLAPQLAASLDQKLDGDKTRRAAWSDLFVASRDWLRSHQRWLANQAMFTNVNLYLSNRAVAAIDPPHALPEDQALPYLYEAAGLVPYLGNEVDGKPERPFGDHFFQVTQKGLSRELGYVGGYGEVGVAGVMEMYDATRPPGGGGGDGDPKLKAQLAKMIRARAPFRYPALDDDGHPAMRLETAVGWRDTHFPGPVLYVQPAGGEQSLLSQAAATLDAAAVGYTQQMFDDNQFFASVAAALKNKNFRATCGLLTLPDDYDLLRAQPKCPDRLPMSAHADFAVADEEAGVVAVKHGDEIFYASLYWRSRSGINSLARVHLLTPRYQQLAVACEDVRFDPSGQTWKRPNWTNFGFANGGFKYPGNLQSALAGEELPIPKLPDGVKLDKRDNPYAGRADFYQLRFGHYLVAMNTTADKSFPLTPPEGIREASELVTGKMVRLDPPPIVGPLKTVVLDLK